jgi:hypothetical protein
VKIEKIPLIVAAIFLALTIFQLPYGYYTLLRLIVCGVGGYLAYSAQKQNQKEWMFYGLFIAVLFNPFILVHFSRDLWVVIDLGVAASFAYLVRKQ